MYEDNNNNNNIYSRKFKFFVMFFGGISIISSSFLIWQLFKLASVETLIRYIVIGILVFIDIILAIKVNRVFKNKVKKKRNSNRQLAFISFLIIYSIICSLVGALIFYLYGQLNSINKEHITYTTNLVTLTNFDATDINDVSDMEIGILSDKKSPDGYIIPNEVIDEYKLNDSNNFPTYDDYTSMLIDLYNGDIDAMFTTDSYVDTFDELPGYENISTETKVIHSKSKKMKKTETSKIESASTGKDVTEPFTILLMGVDSTAEVLDKNAVANGDTLILVTFNPKTLNATMISVPRDTYMPIACWSGQDENKITHAAAYGNDCMINSIQNFFDVNIDYYAKINFKGFVKLIDSVGGVEVDVPQTLCTDDSSRGQEICINEGLQTLNGEQALVFARNRKSLNNGDFGRAEHQQEVVMALINKVKTITDVSVFLDILNTVSNSIDTNLTSEQILSFYNVAKDILLKSLSDDEAELINIQQMFLSGSGQTIYDERSRLNLWNYVPSTASKKLITQAMKENLELVEVTPITSFSFSINEPYEKEVIGENVSSAGSYRLVPNVIGYGEDVAISKLKSAGLRVTVIGNGGTVIKQSYPSGKRIDLTNGTITITLSGSASTEDDKQKPDKEDDKDSEKDPDGSEDGKDPTPTPTPDPVPDPDPEPEPELGGEEDKPSLPTE